MKPVKKILLFLLLLLLAALIAIGIWQRDNLRAAFIALTYDEEKIAENLESVREGYKQEVLDKADVVIKAPTLEQNEGLLNGSLTPDEVKEALGLNDILKPAETTAAETTLPPVTTDPPVTETTAPDTTVAAAETSSAPPLATMPAVPPPVETTTASTTAAVTTAAPKPTVTLSGLTAQQLVDRCVAELTVRQVDLMGELAGMKKAALAEWYQEPPEKQTFTRLKEIGLAGLSRCYDLEKEVDKQVKDILAKYRTELKSIDADDKVLDTLWDYYLEEKAAQKAYYFNKYLK